MTILKVKRGDRITATRWNQLVDRLPGSESGFGASLGSVSRVLALVRNDSGQDIDIGEALAIDDYDGPDDTAIYDVPWAAEFVGVLPVWHTKISRIAIAAAPVPDGDRGPFVLSGMCLVRIETYRSADEFVMIDPASPYRFSTGGAGLGRILAPIPSEEDTQYAMINFRDGDNLWIYELTEDSQAPSDTDAKLFTLSGTEFTSSINLSDPLGIMDDQISGQKGFCIQTGNKFYAIQGPCG